MKEGKQTIKCDVDDCKYHKNQLCTLKSIEVCYCDCEDDSEHTTECHSYKCAEDKENKED